ncbi:hypothetical protein NZNM25_01540 [Nitrosopumilus zosterae]|uniref:Uncharacterized protein n=1 Tax=Nitrosopumilus zosterae TaxID=718286 RepID=A0A2S2KNV8_9ARCH|nr:hypothetical protein [Nitrosopumilus zosterae]BDQ31149.1 hypothetical protein NZOSNM25_001260 [Nitrosopumilus zosterae]GBH33363.1 hypothetical protein NZNM25_01540 [Nitrosopumilus zosterae]
MSQSIRAVVSKKNYDKIIKLTELPFDIGFDKAITLILDKYEKSITKDGAKN